MKWLLILTLAFSFADEGHEHEHKHEAHEEHEPKDEHQEEKSAVVAASKGITAKGENGFQLSAEAVKTFALKFQPGSSAAFEMPLTGLLEIKAERFVYRVRDGWIQKVPVQVARKTSQAITVQISGFQAGDQVIVAGVGFVRTAEMVAEEGVSHGHSH